MAAYAALLSLMHTIQHIKNHPRPPISLDEKQVHSLTQNLTFLQNFLECYSSSGSKEDEDLESRIAGAAYAAEDVIESHIVGQIHSRSTSHGEDMSCVDLYQGVERVIQDMDLIKKEVMQIITEKMGVQHQLHRNSSISVRPASRAQNSTMVDSGDILNKVMDKLTGQQYNLQIVPIVGMGGIGKTTLARNVYENPLIVQHFDILAWVTISQEYSRREILQVLYQGIEGSENDLSRMREDEIGETLRKHLWNRRYLIVMDDIWSIEAWDKINFFFPDNNKGSKIMITTRLSNLAYQLSGSHVFHMRFLDEDKSWDLLCEIVFGKQGCPIELENIGKEIARNCRGLPLSIVVIGGLLRKSKMTIDYWEYTLGNLNSLINLENDEYCLQILRRSYKELPIHLKPCFLYMGVFPEDNEIRVSDLINLWVAEGILKPIDDKSLAEAAKEYVKELIHRNLILVHKLGLNGIAKLLKIHDLLRDVCLREAQKQKFLCMLRERPDLHIPHSMNIERRICIHENTLKEYSPQILHALESASVTRSLLLRRDFHEPSISVSSRLLRVYKFSRVDDFHWRVIDLSFLEAIFQQANLRYLSIEFDFPDKLSRFPSSWSLLWNLQTLKVVIPVWKPIIAPSEIWKMPLLRHVMFNQLELSYPPSGENDFVLENLETLSVIWNFMCSEEVIKRIPKIKKLKLHYERDRVAGKGTLPNFCLNNLGHLQNLESLNLYHNYYALYNPEIFGLTFPHSLKKLTLGGIRLYWEELTAKIGPLPLLEVLKLESNSCKGRKWETFEGQFCSLKFLLIDDCHANLKYWTTDSTHFPRLEHLALRFVERLEEIPSSIGDIPTLQSILLVHCSKSAADSARRIKVEQEDNGNGDLKVQIECCEQQFRVPKISNKQNLLPPLDELTDASLVEPIAVGDYKELWYLV